MRGLVVESVVILVQAWALEHSNSLAQCVLELKHARELLIEAFGLFDALNVGPKRFGQIDCREHLHDCAYDVPTVPGHPTISVGDIRHPGFAARSEIVPNRRMKDSQVLIARSLRCFDGEGIDRSSDTFLQIHHGLAFFARVDCVL
jgi:hypothetical protein